MALFGRETPEEQERIEAWCDWMRRRNPYAIASAVLGIISLIEFGVLLVFGIAGTVLGLVALRQLRQGEAQQPLSEAKPEIGDSDAPVPRDRGHGLAWTGIVTSVVSLIAAAVFYLLPYQGP